jgi:hypothetical protein
MGGDQNIGPNAVEVLAWRSWELKGAPVLQEGAAENAVLMTAVQDGILLSDENGLRFSDKITLVRSAAQFLLATEGQTILSNPTAYFNRLDAIFGEEIGEKERVSGYALAISHNSGNMDAFSWAQQAIAAGTGVFDVLHVMEGAIRHFATADFESVVQFFKTTYDLVKNDLAGGTAYPEMAEWMTQHPEFVERVRVLHEAQPDDATTGLYNCALDALIRDSFADGFQIALSATKSPVDSIAVPATRVLSRIDFGSAERANALTTFIEHCRSKIQSVDSPILGETVAALGRIIIWDPSTIVPMLEEAGRTNRPFAMYAISDFAWREKDKWKDSAWFWPLVQMLVGTSPEHKGILKNVDLAFSMSFRTQDNSSRERAVNFIEAWAARQTHEYLKSAGLESRFPSTMAKIGEDPLVLSRLLTRWLLHEDLRFPDLARKLVAAATLRKNEQPTLNLEIVDQLGTNGIRFLLRRIIGYIVADQAQIALAFSLVRSKDARTRTFSFVRSVLRDQIGSDYPYETIEFLTHEQSAAAEDTGISELCADVISALKATLNAVDSLSDLKEFHPSPDKRRRFSQERARQMNEAVEDATKDSIWRQIATHIRLKAGRRTFQALDDRYSEPMELKEMSHSIPLPRTEVTDPAGAAFQRLLFRTAKRDEP